LAHLHEFQEIDPERGPVGETVTLTYFDITDLKRPVVTVDLDGHPCEITEFTPKAGIVRFLVPQGARTGAVTLSIAGDANIASGYFTVIAADGGGPAAPQPQTAATGYTILSGGNVRLRGRDLTHVTAVALAGATVYPNLPVSQKSDDALVFRGPASGRAGNYGIRLGVDYSGAMVPTPLVIAIDAHGVLQEPTEV
jgi:hypothetical protein